MKTLMLSNLRKQPHLYRLAIETGTVQGIQVQVPDDFPMNPQTIAVTKPKWPAWATKIGERRQPGELGVGDTAERIFGQFGGAKFSAAMQMAGINCGCKARKDS